MNDEHLGRRLPRCADRGFRATLMAFVATLAAAPAGALEIDTGQPDFKLRWDNTFKYSAASRVKSRDPALAPGADQPAAVVNANNADDGDRNFSRGLISNRLDLLSEADLSYRNFGARVSAAAWYDSVYMRSNDNDSAGLLGPGSTTSNSNRGTNEFTEGTRRLHGSRFEMMDVFAYGKFGIGDTLTTVRLGQHAVVWGESLFLGANAIAGAQNATDIIKAASVPNSQVKELVLPVPQISMQAVLTPTVSIGAYYQFQFIPNRIPATGSYFSVSDLGPQGADVAYVGPTRRVPVNVLPTKDSGQGGLQLRLSLGETDVGLYAIRFHQKNLETYSVLGLVSTPTGPVAAPTGFNIARQEDITAFGASFSRTFGAFNLAGETSIRRNTDLPTANLADSTALRHAPANNNTDNTAYPIGNTAHANLSTIWSVGGSPLWSDASLTAEMAWNRMLSCTRSCGTLAANGTRDAWQFVGVFSPTYYQPIAGVNLSVPIGLSYTPKGSRSLALGAGSSGPENGGSMNIGVQGLYLDSWRFGLTYTHFYGRAIPALVPTATLPNFSYGQALKDRDYVSLALSRTF